VRAEEVDRGHEDEPGEDATGEHDAGDARANDVADAEVLGCAVGADAEPLRRCCAPRLGLVVGLAGPEGEEVVVLEESVEAAEAEAEEDTGREAAAALAAMRTSAQAVPSG